MLELVVFVCGAVVMMLEMVGSRVLAPYLGTSIIVWTSLIGVILGSLSLGYWWGGVRADKNPSYRSLSLIIVASGIFIACIAVAKSFVLGFLQDFIPSIRLASATATIILFAPPSVLLGMVSPYAVRLKLISVENSGNTVGRLYAISTVGSIIGTFLGGFYLISYLGSTKILFLLSILLLPVSFISFRGDKVLKAALLACFIALMIMAGSYERHMASTGYYDIDTNYNRIVIYEGRDYSAGPIRIMTTHPSAMQSAVRIEAPNELFLRYTRYFRLATCFKPDAKSFLILGGGGYSFPKYILEEYPDATVDVVELDPKVTDLAREFFFLKDNPKLTIYHEDARSMLNRPGKKYDVILVDVFNSHYSIPFHVTTLETAGKIRERLSDDGVVILNLISGIEGDEGRFLRAEYRTYKTVFPYIRLFPVSDPEDGRVCQNVMLVAAPTPREPHGPDARNPEYRAMLTHLWTKPIAEDMPLLTDDYAPVDSFLF
ncbi:MAG: fused MFS/spermidine synthase [Desulfobacteraceae bacterium]|nr:fused MFS/spermidine synthase [Desulfobacteraceae bacterium]